MDEQRTEPEDAAPAGAQGRKGPACPECGGETRFTEGVSTHDLFAERFVCSSCGRETYRSFGRGSVS
jgi:transposase-like protein